MHALREMSSDLAMTFSTGISSTKEMFTIQKETKDHEIAWFVPKRIARHFLHGPLTDITDLFRTTVQTFIFIRKANNLEYSCYIFEYKSILMNKLKLVLMNTILLLTCCVESSLSTLPTTFECYVIIRFCCQYLHNRLQYCHFLFSSILNLM